MFASIRRYKVDPARMSELEMRIPGAVDAISALSGFRAYYVVKGQDGSVASVSLFSSEASASRSNEVAARYVKEHVADLVGEAIDAITGEVIAYA
jgi:heme-degrading monooxygenase HmoA